jgi:hypothetical protein
MSRKKTDVTPPEAPKVSRSTLKRQNRFLKAFPRIGTVSGTAAAVRISRATVYRWLKAPEFAERFAEAERELNEALDQEVIRRGLRGVEDFVTHSGQLVFISYDEDGNVVPHGSEKAVRTEPYKRRTYSDKLLLAALQARDQRYSEQDGVNVTTVINSRTAWERHLQEERELKQIYEDPELVEMASEFTRLTILKMEEAEQNGNA